MAKKSAVFDPLLNSGNNIFDSVQNDKSSLFGEPPVLKEVSASEKAAKLLASNPEKKPEVFKAASNLFGDDDDEVLIDVRRKREEQDMAKRRADELARKELEEQIEAKYPKKPAVISNPNPPTKLMDQPKAVISQKSAQNSEVKAAVVETKPVVVETKPVAVVKEEEVNIFGNEPQDDDLFSSSKKPVQNSASKLTSQNKLFSSDNSTKDEVRNMDGLFVPSGAFESNSKKKFANKDADLFDVGTDEEFNKFEKNLHLKTHETDKVISSVVADKSNEDELLRSIESTSAELDIAVDENFDMDAYLKQQSSSDKLFD